MPLKKVTKHVFPNRKIGAKRKLWAFVFSTVAMSLAENYIKK